MPTKKGSWRDLDKGDCFTIKSGKVVCEGSAGMNYKKKDKTTQVKTKALKRLTNKPPPKGKDKPKLTARQKKLADKKQTSQKEIKEDFGGYELKELQDTAKAMGLGEHLQKAGQSRTNITRAIFKGGGNLRKKTTASAKVASYQGFKSKEAKKKQDARVAAAAKAKKEHEEKKKKK